VENTNGRDAQFVRLSGKRVSAKCVKQNVCRDVFLNVLVENTNGRDAQFVRLSGKRKSAKQSEVHAKVGGK